METTERIHAENAAQARNVLETGPKPEKIALLKKTIAPLLFHASAHLPTRQETIPRTEEGRSGILPAPAKRLIATEVLSGNQPPPLRIHEETIPIGDPYKKAKQATIHLITEVTPDSIIDERDVEALAELLAGTGPLTREKNTYWSDPTNPKQQAVVVGQTRAILHLIRQNMLGSVSYTTHEINGTSEVADAMGAYNNELLKTITYDPSDTPADSAIAHAQMYQKILTRTSADHTDDSISLAFCLQHRDGSTLQVGHTFPTIELAQFANDGKQTQS
jgi:hypothetical protein